jgi:hypothetical protein
MPSCVETKPSPLVAIWRLTDYELDKQRFENRMRRERRGRPWGMFVYVFPHQMPSGVFCGNPALRVHARVRWTCTALKPLQNTITDLLDPCMRRLSCHRSRSGSSEVLVCVLWRVHWRYTSPAVVLNVLTGCTMPHHETVVNALVSSILRGVDTRLWYWDSRHSMPKSLDTGKASLIVGFFHSILVSKRERA